MGRDDVLYSLLIVVFWLRVERVRGGIGGGCFPVIIRWDLMTIAGSALGLES